MEKATTKGFRVDGLQLAKAFINQELIDRLERLLFNEASLSFLKTKGTRIEFITDGPLPPELLDEPSLKREPIYKQAIAYNICKACRLCIEVCPKHVYKDDGFGRPGITDRREEECTGSAQCGQCADICPENAIHIIMANPVLQSTIFVLLPNPFFRQTLDVQIPPCPPLEKGGWGGFNPGRPDFFVVNPMEVDGALKIPAPVAPPQGPNPKNLADCNRQWPCHRLLNESGFYPLLEVKGYPRHFVDSKDPGGDLKIWAKENGRDPALVLEAVLLLYEKLPRISSLKRGKYRLDEIIHRIIDEMIFAAGETDNSPRPHAMPAWRGPLKLRGGEGGVLDKIVREAFVEDLYLGAKARPIGGLLPPATSTAWKTPYGEEIPDYVHMEKCLGPECGLCVTHCPEGGGGNNSAIRMVLKVPQGTIPALVRGLDAFLLRCDGLNLQSEDLEDLRGKTPFEFEVDPDFCKACGICIACCPHDVIEPMTRHFDLRQGSITQEATKG